MKYISNVFLDRVDTDSDGDYEVYLAVDFSDGSRTTVLLVDDTVASLQQAMMHMIESLGAES